MTDSVTILACRVDEAAITDRAGRDVQMDRVARAPDDVSGGDGCITRALG